MNHRQAKRYAARELANVAVIRAGLIEGLYRRGDNWDQLSLADSRRVVRALRMLGEELEHRATGRRFRRPQPLIDPDQAALFEEVADGS